MSGGRPPVSRVDEYWRERASRLRIECAESECWNRKLEILLPW